MGPSKGKKGIFAGVFAVILGGLGFYQAPALMVLGVFILGSNLGILGSFQGFWDPKESRARLRVGQERDFGVFLGFFRTGSAGQVWGYFRVLWSSFFGIFFWHFGVFYPRHCWGLFSGEFRGLWGSPLSRGCSLSRQ